MKKAFFYIFVVMFLFTGCRPRGILSSGQMRKILVDLHRTDGIVLVAGYSSTDHEIRDVYYAQVLDRHGVTQAEFDSSLVWYTTHPQFFNKIYPKVLQDLEAEETAFVALHESELGTQHSIASTTEIEKSFTKTDLDSVLWVAQHGYPTTWQPLVHDLEYQFFP